MVSGISLLGTLTTDTTEIPQDELGPHVSVNTENSSRTSPRVWASGMVLTASLATTVLTNASVPPGISSLTQQTSSPSTNVSRLSFWLDSSDTYESISALPDSSSIVRQLHKNSGLTWEQLARLFSVSRRAIHLWASGGNMTASHLEILRDFARLVSRAPTATPGETRDWLYGSGSDSHSPLEQFIEDHRRREVPIKGSGYTPSELLEGGVD